MMVLRARRGATGPKYETFRSGMRRTIPFLLRIHVGDYIRLQLLRPVPMAALSREGASPPNCTALRP